MEINDPVTGAALMFGAIALFLCFFVWKANRKR